jgi:hypothetical protein
LSGSQALFATGKGTRKYSILGWNVGSWKNIDDLGVEEMEKNVTRTTKGMICWQGIYDSKKQYVI